MKPSRTLITAAKAVVMAKAMVETLRPQVEKIQQDILDDFGFECSKEWTGRRATTDKLTPKTAYLMSDEDFAIYHDELQKEYRRAGLPKVKEGQCPLLVAEENLRQAERIFAAACVELTARAGLGNEQIEDLLNCRYGLDERKKFIDLNLKYVVPFIPRKELWMRA